MDSWGSQDILAGFEPADPRSNRGESVIILLVNPYQQKFLRVANELLIEEY